MAAPASGNKLLLISNSVCHGKPYLSHCAAAHQALYHRARCNQDARRGEYSAAMDAAGVDQQKRT
jgi:hypothetical protein